MVNKHSYLKRLCSAKSHRAVYGFTLIETLVVAALLGVVAAGGAILASYVFGRQLDAFIKEGARAELARALEEVQWHMQTAVAYEVADATDDLDKGMPSVSSSQGTRLRLWTYDRENTLWETQFEFRVIAGRVTANGAYGVLTITRAKPGDNSYNPDYYEYGTVYVPFTGEYARPFAATQDGSLRAYWQSEDMEKEYVSQTFVNE